MTLEEYKLAREWVYAAVRANDLISRGSVADWVEATNQENAASAALLARVDRTDGK